MHTIKEDGYDISLFGDGCTIRAQCQCGRVIVGKGFNESSAWLFLTNEAVAHAVAQTMNLIKPLKV